MYLVYTREGLTVNENVHRYIIPQDWRPSRASLRGGSLSSVTVILDVCQCYLALKLTMGELVAITS